MSFKKSIEQLHAMLARLNQDYKDELIKAANEVFKEFPKLKVISWPVYTPGFNDGEPCYNEFGEPKFSFDTDKEPIDIDGNSDEYDENEVEETVEKLEEVLKSKSFKEFSQLFQLKNFVEDNFGTNQSIIFTRAQGDCKLSFEDYDCGY